MRIAVFAGGYPPRAASGAERCIQDLVRVLVDAGHHVELITRPGPADVPEGVTVRRLLRAGIWPLAIASASVAALRVRRADVILCSFAWFEAAGVGLVRRALKGRIVIRPWVSGPRGELGRITRTRFVPGPLESVRAWCRRRIVQALRRADILIPECRLVSDEFAEAGFARAVPIPSLVDLAPFAKPQDRDKCRERFGAERARLVLVAVGRLVDQKGFDRLIRAAQHVLSDRDLLLIAGEGPQRSMLETLAGDDKRIRLLGQVSEPAHLLGAADGFVVSSDAEGGPTTLYEAMAAGLPVVSTPVGLAPELPVILTEDLTTGLSRLIEMTPEERRVVGEHNRTVALQELDRRAVAGRWLATLEDLVGHQARASTPRD